MTYTQKLQKVDELKTILKRIDRKYTRAIGTAYDRKTRRDLLRLRKKTAQAIDMCNELQFKYTNKLIKAEAARLRRKAGGSDLQKTRAERLADANVFLRGYSAQL